MLHPYSVYRRSNIYTLITSGLIHGSWMHLIFNMFYLFLFCFCTGKYDRQSQIWCNLYRRVNSE
ncbi:rhomboid family intramembrane serine protease [Pedobacter antarcticus]|uniref:rhomboid family intramembrane serine protease n=1 Tax=Pedobacter antarcticus TaxID=34086 RepID=UPI002934BCE3|nr:rhomboid family intramembrane serine protease [Pedobacter antarcticus]